MERLRTGTHAHIDRPGTYELRDYMVLQDVFAQVIFLHNTLNPILRHITDQI